MRHLADVQQAVGRLDESCDLYRETLEVQTAMLGPQHAETVATTVGLGTSLLRQEKYAEAESHLTGAREALQARQQKNLPNFSLRPSEVLERLVELYTAWDRPDEAAKWRKELEAKTAVEQSASTNSRPLNPEH